jgi:hypothetical protein
MTYASEHLVFRTLKHQTWLQVEDVWLATIMAVTHICHEPNGHLRNHAALVLTGYATSLMQHNLHCRGFAFRGLVQR